MRYKCIVSYDGTNYQGWQKQKGERTIQETIEQAISKIANQPIKIVGAGRTDRYVHSYGQTFHFDLDKQYQDIRKAINSQLPNDIFIRSVEVVDDDFHSRFSACYKHYDYLINDGQYNPLMRNYCCYNKDKLDIELMKKASKIFIGTHDFTSFNSTSKTEIEDQVRTIYKIDIVRENGFVKISFYGDGFLRYMVRILSKCLMEVGSLRINEDDIKKMLDQKDKQACSYNGCPNGLYLMEVGYQPFDCTGGEMVDAYV